MSVQQISHDAANGWQMCIAVDAPINQLLGLGISATELRRGEDWTGTGIAMPGEVALHDVDVAQEGKWAIGLTGFDHNAPFVIEKQAENHALARFVEEHLGNRRSQVCHAESIDCLCNLAGITCPEDGQLDKGSAPCVDD